MKGLLLMGKKWIEMNYDLLRSMSPEDLKAYMAEYRRVVLEDARAQKDAPVREDDDGDALIEGSSSPYGKMEQPCNHGVVGQCSICERAKRFDKGHDDFIEPVQTLDTNEPHVEDSYSEPERKPPYAEWIEHKGKNNTPAVEPGRFEDGSAAMFDGLENDPPTWTNPGVRR